jgi:hypothetical protein
MSERSAVSYPERTEARSQTTWAEHPLVQLTRVRAALAEFTREPEAMFWALIFPVLLSAGLGIAFRNRPPEVLKIAAVTPRIADALRKKLLDVRQLSMADAERASNGTGRAASCRAGRHRGLSCDDTNPEGRAARLLADGAIQRAEGRADPVDRPID